MASVITLRAEVFRPKPTGRGMPSTAAEQAGESTPSSPATAPLFPDPLNIVPGRPPEQRLELRLGTGCDWMESLERGRRAEQSLSGSAGRRRSQRSARRQVPYAAWNEGRGRLRSG